MCCLWFWLLLLLCLRRSKVLVLALVVLRVAQALGVLAQVQQVPQARVQAQVPLRQVQQQQACRWGWLQPLQLRWLLLLRS